MPYDWLHIPAVKFSTIDQERKKKKKSIRMKIA